jgi:hypothetical protein
MEKTPFSKNNKKQTHKPQNTPRVVTAQSTEGSTAQKAVAGHQTASCGAPRANLCLARGPGVAPRSLRLEGLTSPRASLHLA